LLMRVHRSSLQIHQASVNAAIISTAIAGSVQGERMTAENTGLFGSIIARPSSHRRRVRLRRSCHFLPTFSGL